MTQTEPTARKADAELSISVAAPKRTEAAAVRTQKNAELAASAAAMRERNAAAREAEQTNEKTELPPPHEDVESIEVVLIDKRKILLGPPPGVSLTMRIALNIPEATTNQVIDKLARVLMSVRSIDEKVPAPITNLVSMQALANVIGDVGIDELNFWFDRHWGNLRISDLQLIKKNLR